ncbi:hypothetical protein [Gracilibacillus massiliensis]|uniref:hypothetical protein n=1 Tax=Gracilibacillus massiliensis TaxID=1564956 RepID=UPI00071DFFD3|nr:hypothetical protein [Gracilibacillus massiliensis]
MTKNRNQKGFYILETLISTMLFFTVCLTLLPIQYHLLLEKKIIHEETAAIYFLSEELHKAILNQPEEDKFIYHDVISTPITIEFTSTPTLLKGCVTWINAKQTKQTKCLHGKPV